MKGWEHGGRKSSSFQTLTCRGSQQVLKATLIFIKLTGFQDSQAFEPLCSRVWWKPNWVLPRSSRVAPHTSLFWFFTFWGMMVWFHTQELSQYCWGVSPLLHGFLRYRPPWAAFPTYQGFLPHIKTKQKPYHPPVCRHGTRGLTDSQRSTKILHNIEGKMHHLSFVFYNSLSRLHRLIISVLEDNGPVCLKLYCIWQEK